MRPRATKQRARSVVLVERFVAGINPSRLEEIAQRSDERFLGAIAIPDDETCIYLFTGGEPLLVAALGDRAVPALLAGPWLSSQPGRKC